MSSSSKRRKRASRRWKRVLALSLCTVSFLGGELLFGQAPAEQLAPTAQQLAPTEILPAVQVELRSSAPSGNADEASLAPIVSAAQARRGNETSSRATSPRATAQRSTFEPSIPGMIKNDTLVKPAGNLAPVVSAASMPRPQRTPPAEQAPVTEAPATQTPATQPSAASPSPWMKDIHATLAEMNQPAEATQETAEELAEDVATEATIEPVNSEAELAESTPVRVELSRPAFSPSPPRSVSPSPTPSPVAHAFRPQPQPQTQREEPVFLAAQPAPQAVLPVRPGPVPGALMVPGGMPVGSPFEVIEESGSVTVSVRRSKLMRTKIDIYRTAVVDEGVCEIVQFTPREISLIGRSVGSTHITFWFDDPAMQPVTYLVTVKPDAEAVRNEEDRYKLLEDVINEMFPDSKIHLLIVANKLIVKGQAKDAEEAAQIMSLITTQSGQRGGFGGGNAGIGGGLAEGMAAPVLSDDATGGANNRGLMVINMLRVPGIQQVALKVKIAELDRSAARGFGVDVRGVVDIGSSASGSKLFLNSILNMAAGTSSTLMAQFDGDDIQVGIRYLQQHGVIRLLSEPTLVTMSGTPATFIAGGEFAVPTVVGSAGLNAVTTDFRAFGAIISFMPTVIDKDRIRLQVAPEFSQINSGLTVNNTPGLKVRAATTTVEMREGQTLAIAGLLEDNLNGSTVGDLPFVARIFGRRSMSHSETELIILVTPELVHPLDAEEVPPLPGFDVTEPTNGQFFLHGDIEGNPTQDYRSTVWPRLKKRYGSGGPAMTSGPFGHGQ